MSWVEKIKTDFVITCGDGLQYRPQWLNAVKKVEWNISEFEFPDLDGTLVKKKKRKGARYGLELYFQGEDHLDQSNAFQASADDERPWIITHPFYGSITVQPNGLNIDNQVLNVTKITGTVIETITEDNPKTYIDPLDNISLEKLKLDEKIIISFDAVPSPTDVNSMQKSNDKLYNEGSKLPLLAEETEGYFNAFNTANAAILTATSQPLQAIRTLQAVINAPALFTNGVKARMSLLYTQFMGLGFSILGSTKRPSKIIYEAQGATLLSAMCLAASNPKESDYKNRTDVTDIIDLLVGSDGNGNPTGAYTMFVKNLDDLQSENGGDPDSYIPKADTLISLNKLINFTLSSLFTIALGAKQERSIYCEEDTNIILLTHRFYGMDPNDENIETLITNNNIGLNELLQIRKGRRIVYYV